MTGFFRAALAPDPYHGHGKKPPFFEGWYYKVIDQTERHRFAFIPGIMLSGAPHAFIQVLDGVTGRTVYHTYPVEAFRADPNRFEVHIGPNRFTANGLRLEIDRPEQTLRGELTFTERAPWPVTPLSPGIMGWYAWVPFMECYHGVVSLDHGVHGTLRIDERNVAFSGGRGYTEKDWGRSFPSAWIWMQTNHFDTPGTSLTASTAVIPWLRSAFRGFIIGLRHGDRLYRFATYTGARTEELAVTDELVCWTVRDRKHRLSLRATRSEGAGLLRGPTTVDMGKRVAETMSGRVSVRLSRLGRASESLVFSETGRHAGLEVHNVNERLLKL